MLKELSRPLNCSLSSSKVTNSNYKSPQKTFIKTSLTKSISSPFSKMNSGVSTLDSPVNVFSSTSTTKNINNSTKYTTINFFNPLASSIDVNNSKNQLMKSVEVGTSLDYVNTLSQSAIKKKHKNYLIENITKLSKKVSHCHSQINIYKKCNEQTAKENLEIEFAQDNIIHERIHMTGIIPRLRVRINDMRDEILKLDKETKYYEILKYQFNQEKVFMEDDLKKMEKKVKEIALHTNALSYQVSSFKKRIKQAKIILSQQRKENSFIKDVTKLISV